MVFWEKQRLEQVWQSRQVASPGCPLGGPVNTFMKRIVQPRRRRLSLLGRAWIDLLPPELVEHSCLESLRGGRLKILVDSSSHLYELNLLVKEGLLDELRERCPSVPLSEIRLVHGLWYKMDDEEHRIPRY